MSIYKTVMDCGGKIKELEKQKPPTWENIQSEAKSFTEIKKAFCGNQKAFDSYCRNVLRLEGGYAEAVIFVGTRVQTLQNLKVTPVQAIAMAMNRS